MKTTFINCPIYFCIPLFINLFFSIYLTLSLAPCLSHSIACILRCYFLIRSKLDSFRIAELADQLSSSTSSQHKKRDHCRKKKTDPSCIRKLYGCHFFPLYNYSLYPASSSLLFTIRKVIFYLQFLLFDGSFRAYLFFLVRSSTAVPQVPAFVPSKKKKPEKSKKKKTRNIAFCIGLFETFTIFRHPKNKLFFL